MEKLKGITVRINNEQREFLKRLRNEGVSHSFILRRALNEYMRQNNYTESTNVIQLQDLNSIQD